MSLAALSHLQLALGSLKQAVEAGGALGKEDRSAVQQIAHELLDLSKPSLGDLPLPHRPSESQIEGGSQEQAIEATEATEEEEPQGFVIPQGLGPLPHHASERSVASQAKLARRHSNLSEASEADSDASDSEAASSGGFSSVFSERSGCETEAAPRRSTSEDGVRRALRVQREVLLSLFHQMDVHNQGVLEANDLERALRSVGQHPARAQKLIAAADENCNGKVEIAEWTHVVDRLVAGKGSEAMQHFTTALVNQNQHLPKAGSSYDERSQQRRVCISCQNPFRMAWDLLLLTLLVYIAVVLPYILAYLNETSFHRFVSDFIDVCFCIDIVLNFCTSYLDEGGDEIDSPKRVAITYLKSWFALDLITAVPLQHLASSIPESMDSIKLLRGSKVFKILKVVRAVKLLKVMRASNLGTRIEDYMMHSSSGRRFFELLRILVSCCLLCHLLACFMQISGTGFLDTYEWDNETSTSKYISSLYWAMTTVTTVGYGDIVPRSDDERVFTMLAMILGGAFYGYVVGNISVILASNDVNWRAKKERLEVIDAWLTHHRFPLRLRRRIWGYYKVTVSSQVIWDDSVVFSELSEELREEVASFLIHPELGRNMVFRGVPARILIRLVSILQQLRVKRNERVVPNPKLDYGMFIILDGSAVLQKQISPLPSQRLTSPKDKLTEVLRRSDSFGEEVLLGLKAEYEYTVQATRRLVLLLLPRDSFMERLSPMPEMFTLMRANFTA